MAASGSAVVGEDADEASDVSAPGDEPTVSSADRDLPAAQDVAETDEADRRAGGTPYGTVLVALLVVAGVQLGQRPLNDNSFLTHLATGRLILDRGTIPTTDPYSFSAQGEPWTVQSWLASVAYASLERLGGLTAVRVLIIVLTTVLLLLVWRLTDEARSLAGRVLLLVGVVVVANDYWSERPALIGLIGVALVLLAARDEMHPAWLIPVMWVWCNSHGSFPFAPVILGLLVVGRWMDRSSPRAEMRALAACLVGIAVAVVNPLGWRLLVFPATALDKREAFTSIVEWQAPGWDRPSQWAFAALAVGGLVALGLRHRRWRSILPTVAFAVAAATSMRNIAPATIVIVASVAPALASLGTLKVDDRRAINRTATVAFSAIAVVFLVVGLAGPDTDLEPFPAEVAAWMEDEGLTGPDVHVLTSEVAGNYFEARFGPDEVRVFIDDRVDMYPIEVIETYRSLIDPERSAEFAETLASIDPTMVVWSDDSALGRWLLDGGDEAAAWRVEHRVDGWLVAVPA